MSETLRKRLMSYAGLTIMFMMVFGTLWQAMPVKVAHAAGGDGASSSITLLDSDANGKLDRITFSIANPNTETWQLDGCSPYGLSVTYDGADITISSVSVTSAATNPATIQVDLDESDSDLSRDTSNSLMEMTYTQNTGDQTCINCILDGVDEELNPITSGDTGEVDTEADGAAPQISRAGYGDVDADGKIDIIKLYFSENITAASVIANENLDFGSGGTGVGDFTDLAFGSATADLIDSTVSRVNVNMGTEASVVDTYNDGETISILTMDAGADFSITDGTNENTTPKMESQIGTLLDRAKPVVASATPTDQSTAQIRTNSVVYNFSEPMASDTWVEGTDFESTPDPGGWSGSMSTNDTSITLSHAPFLCIQEYSIAITEASVEAENGETGFTVLNDASTAPIGETHTFTSKTCTGTSTSTAQEEETVYEIDVLTPNGGEELTVGEEYEITWESSPEPQYYVDLYYSLDGEYVEIATGETNNGSYTWDVPEGVEDSMVKVVWNDLADELDSDTSDAEFNDTDGVTEVVEEEVEETKDTVLAPTGTGISPVTGEEEEITAVEPGDYISSPSFSTVYYVTEDYERRAFISSVVYYTYADSLDEIKEVTNATLSALDLVDNILPNPSVVLVKVQSDPKTYAVDEGYNLRWITSEEVAEDLYGENWADYIIDVDVTFFAQFGSGEDVDEASDIEVGDMKTREEVSQ